MPRYIDADKLMKDIRQRAYLTDNIVERPIYAMTLLGIQQTVDEQPTVSPYKVRGAGKWIKREKVRPNLPDDSDYEFECSCCGWRDLHNAKMIVPYCWHCGAKMEVSE